MLFVIIEQNYIILSFSPVNVCSKNNVSVVKSQNGYRVNLNDIFYDTEIITRCDTINEVSIYINENVHKVENNLMFDNIFKFIDPNILFEYTLSIDDLAKAKLVLQKHSNSFNFDYGLLDAIEYNSKNFVQLLLSYSQTLIMPHHICEALHILRDPKITDDILRMCMQNNETRLPSTILQKAVRTKRVSVVKYIASFGIYDRDAIKEIIRTNQYQMLLIFSLRPDKELFEFAKTCGRMEDVLSKMSLKDGI